MLKIKNLSKSFGNLEVLKDLTFNVEEGSFISITGPSGCGKTVLLKIIAGLESSSSGKVLVKEGVNPIILWQDFKLLPWRNVYKNILFSIEEKDMPQKIKDKKVGELLKFIGLYAFKDYYPYQLSGGMQQRVVLARGLITEPQLLLLDEPFSNIEWEKTQRFYKELKQIQREKKLTIIQVTHDIPNALEHSNKIIILSHRPTKIKAILGNVKNTLKMQRRILKLSEPGKRAII